MIIIKLKQGKFNISIQNYEFPHSTHFSCKINSNLIEEFKKIADNIVNKNY